MTATDIRSLLVELADKLDHYHQALMDDRRCTHPLADRAREVAAQQPTADALQAAADAERYACCEFLEERGFPHTADALRAARRPPAPSLKERAIKALREGLDHRGIAHLKVNRDAMELALQALEGGDG